MGVVWEGEGGVLLGVEGEVPVRGEEVTQLEVWEGGGLRDYPPSLVPRKVGGAVEMGVNSRGCGYWYR